MPHSTTPPPRPTATLASLIAAGVVLLSLAAGGVWSIGQQAMAPSALPPSLAIASEGPKTGLSKDTHSQLRLSSSGPDWKDISAAQRTVLEPLSQRWPALSALTKRRWLLLADRYPGMEPAEQEKLQERMETWANLSAQQRSQARLNFANVKQMTPEELRAKWEEYLALSEAEKKRLAAEARKAKSKGAAATQRANNRRKLARVPAAANAPHAANPPKIPTPTSAHQPPVTAVEMPVFTPQATPHITLQPLPPPTHSHAPSASHPSAPATAAPPAPIAASQPVQVPQTMHTMDLPPLELPAPHTAAPAQPAAPPVLPSLSPAAVPAPAAAPHPSGAAAPASTQTTPPAHAPHLHEPHPVHSPH